MIEGRKKSWTKKKGHVYVEQLQICDEEDSKNKKCFLSVNSTYLISYSPFYFTAFVVVVFFFFLCRSDFCRIFFSFLFEQFCA